MGLPEDELDTYKLKTTWPQVVGAEESITHKAEIYEAGFIANSQDECDQCGGYLEETLDLPGTY